MKMIEKLALQKELGGLLLFRDGLFLKAYNESSYILTELLQQNLKVSCQQLKCLNSRWIMESAFQYSKLAKRLPKAVKTEFGATLSGEFNLLGYEDWYLRRCHAENEVQGVAKAEARPLQTVSPSASAHNLETVYKASILLPLSKQQLAYLQTWQRELYPLEVDFGFIESLKQQVMPLGS